MDSTEREARDTALRQAIANDPGASADVIVSDADQFRRFLMGEPQKDDAENPDDAKVV